MKPAHGSARRHQQARRNIKAVPAADVGGLRQLASELRAGGQQAQRLRAEGNPTPYLQLAQTGDELLAFFRNSPLVGESIEFERDRS